MVLLLLCFLIFVVARAQKPPLSGESPLISPTGLTSTSKLPPTQILSYNPGEICFNPHRDPYFQNDLLSTCPVPKPNVYFGNQNLAAQSSRGLIGQSLDDEHFAPSITLWSSNYESKNFIPRGYISIIPRSGSHSNRGGKQLKNAEPQKQTTLPAPTPPPKNRFEIKFGNFPPANVQPQGLGLADYKSTNREDHRIDEKKASSLIDYSRRKRKRRNEDESNVCPLSNPILEPKTTYNTNQLIAEIYNQNF